MARVKQANPKRIPPANDHDPITEAAESLTHRAEAAPDHGSSIFQLIICVGGIYVSFLLWALLQERITTTAYGPDNRIFRHALVLNTVQSLFASISGYLYFRLSASASSPKRVFPSLAATLRLALVATTQTLASPFGYASLKHIDYITYILAKSCKLLPVMFLHVTLFRRRYPLYKYLVVLAVSAGVAVFTLYPSHPKKAKKASAATTAEKDVAWGMFLLSCNLLFDGLTNTIQDDIFAKAPKGSVSGPQMMAALNTISSCLTGAWLLLNPWSSELGEAAKFVLEHPKVGLDILGFAFCGAVGQVFIFHTLAKFGSLVLVTVTVTRKMLSMIFSVIAFGHSLSMMQMFGVGLVFSGIGWEAEVKRQSELAKKAAKMNGHVKKE
ncbi:UAA transporter [Sphaerosporella brunnea]|uniref:UDP-galactose transporter homolog 1 n=1 Tax=Sphaerosporella brunnea TaxID=1250544 RepID=A0A5J5F7G7_9PEZI|nr:UAA transporter [Sphaerosporella brunnea]